MLNPILVSKNKISPISPLKTGFGLKLAVFDLFNPLGNRRPKSDLAHRIEQLFSFNSMKKPRMESNGTIFRAISRSKVGIFLTGKDRHPDFDKK